MKAQVAVVLFAILVTFANVDVRAQSGNSDLMRPGMWEITIQMESPIVGPPAITEVCITPDRANPRPKKSTPKDECQVVELPAPRGEVRYSSKCNKEKVSSTANFVYSGDRYEGSVVTDLDGVEIRQKHSGKRIGACEPLPKGPAGTEE